MARVPAVQYIKEPNKEVKVVREADVVVVGGGPGGIGAAVSAARAGADTVLIERYGHLGGMATGGVVTIIPNLCDVTGKQQIAGITQEWIDRLDAREASDYPRKEHWGSDDKKLVSYYADRSFFYTRLNRVIYSVHIDAEISKCIMNDLVEEAGVKTYLHSWGTQPVMEGDTVKGVVFESKSGRQAILAKVVIDSTGDGDLLPFTPAKFDTDINPKLRISNLALCFWIDNVDFEKAENFRKNNPQKYGEQARELMQLGGLPGYFKTNLKNQHGIMWVHTRYPNKSQIDVEELTRVEFEGRKKMLITYDYRKKNTPGFENSFIVLTDPQLGTRSSRRVHGDFMHTEKDLNNNTPPEDTIATFPDLDRGELSLKHPNFFVSYRSLIPREVNNMLVACRAFSSDQQAQEWFNLIPHCVAFGQAAGTAAAMAARENKSLRDINIKSLQSSLRQQNVPLP
jgi:hypothetical protein